MPSNRRFAVEVGADRLREIRKRHRRRDAVISKWLRANHPRLYAKALDEAEQRIYEERGPLPGDEPGDES